MKSVRLLFFFFLFAAVLPVVAQQPVRWRSFVEMHGNGEGTLGIQALVEPGWHLYGLELPAGGPKATAFDFSGSEGIKFTGELTPARAAKEVKDDMFGMELSWWDSNIEFYIPFKVTSTAPVYKCTVSYMTCDGNTCMPPVKQSMTGKIKMDSK